MNNFFIMMEKALSNVNLKNQFLFRRLDYFPEARLQDTGMTNVMYTW